MRIFSWNINGITPFLQKPITSFFKTASKPGTPKDAVPPASLRDFLRRHHWPAMLLLQEVKIASKDIKIQDAVRLAVNTPSPPGTNEPQYEAHFTLPTDPHNARGPRGSEKVYGVCSILRRDLREKYNVNTRTVAWDAEGRVSTIELTSGEAKLAVLNIYAVNGTHNPYRDPMTGAHSGTRHDRKLAFHAALAAECKSLEQNGWHVLIGGDMNVAPDARDGYPKLRTVPAQHVVNRADLHDQLLRAGEGGEGFGGVDVWRQTHGEERRYTYHPRGGGWGTSCDRIDYFIAARRTWHAGLVTDSGILDTAAARGPSDHVPVWVDIAFEPESKTP